MCVCVCVFNRFNILTCWNIFFGPFQQDIDEIRTMFMFLLMFTCSDAGLHGLKIMP